MKRRGRPPHPDILTPREWEVLGLLRDGLSNPEIAERLGVTRDAVKYHVSEILSKLALASREEAAVWRPTEHPWWAAAFAALAGAASRLSPLARIAAVGLSVAALGWLERTAPPRVRSSMNRFSGQTLVWWGLTAHTTPWVCLCLTTRAHTG